MKELCVCGAVLGHFPEAAKKFSAELGTCVGMAFQLYDDLMDCTRSSCHLKKTTYRDIQTGVITAPLLFARLDYPDDVTALLLRRCRGEGDAQKALDLIHSGLALPRTRLLVFLYAAHALKLLEALPPPRGQDEGATSTYARALAALLHHTLTRQEEGTACVSQGP
eukprot:GHVT01037407.1.p3 GENE.GHVT01037407.1~~GHVT01037407.1.p3  ORF type:complete len:166 (+),score=28.42 GHVT01037407.1:615-1112(+)